MISFILPNHSEDQIHNVISEIECLFQGSQIVISCDRYGRGKGWAIRQAVEQCDNDLICFLDGDLDIRPKMLLRLLPFLDEYDIVVGKKEATGGIKRKILTSLSRLYIRALFGLKVDTQTGIKIFKRYSLPTWTTNSFAYDIEVLARAKKTGWKMCEVQIEAKISKSMPWKALLITFLDSIRIKYELVKM